MGLGTLMRRGAPVEARDDAGISVNDWATMFTFDGHTYGVSAGIAQQARNVYSTSGPVGALVTVRQLIFSDIRFQWQALDNGPGRLFGTSALDLLERPWIGGTTGSLLSVMEIDNSLSGNCYLFPERLAFRNETQLTRLDPTKMSILTGDLAGMSGVRYGKYLAGYAYKETPYASEVELFLPGDIVHYKPRPCGDMPQFRGESWLQPVLGDIKSDQQMTEYKEAFLRNGAVPALVMSFDAGVTKEQFDAVVRTVESSHVGPSNAFRTLYVGAGAKPTMLGADFSSLNLDEVQGAGESRLAAAAGVPASIAGFSEGMKGSSLNAGNYSATRRRFSDGTMRPLWREACGALGVILPAPTGARLWIDERWCSFLQEDIHDDAEIRSLNATAIRTLIDGGFEPDAAIQAISPSTLAPLIGKHTGFLSVQLQQPGATPPTTAPAPPGGAA